MKKALLALSVVLFLASTSSAQTNLGPRGPVAGAPELVAPEVTRELDAYAGQLSAIGSMEIGPMFTGSIESIQQTAQAEGPAIRREAARLMISAVARLIDERALMARGIPRPLATRLGVLALRAHTASRSDPKLSRLLDSIRHPEEAAPAKAPATAMKVVQRFKKGVFEVDWEGRNGVLKTIAEENEGRVQKAAGTALEEADIRTVSVPRVHGDWHVLDIPQSIAPEARAERAANKRFVFMEKAPGISIKTLIDNGHRLDQPAHVLAVVPELIEPEALARLKKAIRVLHEQGIAHGDLDPLNIHVNQSGGQTNFHIIDWEFGSTKARGKAKKDDRVQLGKAIDYLENNGFVGEPKKGGGTPMFAVMPFGGAAQSIAEFGERTIHGATLAGWAAYGGFFLATVAAIIAIASRYFRAITGETEPTTEELSRRFLVTGLLVIRCIATCALLVYVPFPANLIGAVLTHVGLGRAVRRVEGKA
jgi:hypothetical protein